MEAIFWVVVFAAGFVVGMAGSIVVYAAVWDTHLGRHWRDVAEGRFGRDIQRTFCEDGPHAVRRRHTGSRP